MATFTTVKTGSAASGTSLALTSLAAAVTAGNFVAVSVTVNVSGTISISDTKGNTYVAGPDSGLSGSIRNQIFYVLNATALATTDTITITHPSGVCVVAVAQCNTGWTTNAVDKTAAATGTGATANTGATATRTNATEILFCGLGYVGSTTATVGTSWTILSSKISSGSGGTATNLSTEYQNVTVTGTDAGTWAGMSGSTAWSVCIITIMQGGATTVTEDVTTSSAQSVPETKDVTSTSAQSAPATKDITTSSAQSGPKTTDVTTTAAVSRTATSDVTTTAAISYTPPPYTVTKVGSVTFGSGGGNVTVSGITAGHTVLVCVVTNGNASNVSTPTDGAGNTYATAVNTGTGTLTAIIFYADNIVASGISPIAVASTNSRNLITVLDINGTLSTGSLDKTNTGSGNSTATQPATSATATLANAAEIAVGVIAVLQAQSGQTVTQGSGWVLEDSLSLGAAGASTLSAVEYQIPVGTAGVTATGVIANDVSPFPSWSAAVATFLPSPTVKDVSTTAAVSGTLTLSVPTTAAISTTNTTSVTTTAAVSSTLTLNVSSTAAISTPEKVDVSSGAAVSGVAGTSLSTTAAVSSTLTVNVTTVAAISVAEQVSITTSSAQSAPRTTDVSTTSAQQVPEKTDVTTAAAVSGTLTLAITTLAAIAVTEQTNVTTSSAQSAPRTTDVTTTSAQQVPENITVATTAAVSGTNTEDLPTTAATSISERSDVSSSAAVSGAITKDVTTTSSIATFITLNISTVAAISGTATEDVSTSSAQSTPNSTDVPTASAQSTPGTTNVTSSSAQSAPASTNLTTIAAVSTFPTLNVTTLAAVSGVATSDVLTSAAISELVTLTVTTLAAIIGLGSASVSSSGAVSLSKGADVATSSAISLVVTTDVATTATISTIDVLSVTTLAAISEPRNQDLSTAAAIFLPTRATVETTAAIALSTSLFTNPQFTFGADVVDEEFASLFTNSQFGTLVAVDRTIIIPPNSYNFSPAMLFSASGVVRQPIFIQLRQSTRAGFTANVTQEQVISMSVNAESNFLFTNIANIDTIPEAIIQLPHKTPVIDINVSFNVAPGSTILVSVLSTIDKANRGERPAYATDSSGNVWTTLGTWTYEGIVEDYQLSIFRTTVAVAYPPSSTLTFHLPVPTTLAMARGSCWRGLGAVRGTGILSGTGVLASGVLPTTLSGDLVLSFLTAQTQFSENPLDVHSLLSTLPAWEFHGYKQVGSLRLNYYAGMFSELIPVPQAPLFSLENAPTSTKWNTITISIAPAAVVF